VRLESGHHAESWLELDQLFRNPGSLRPFAEELARRVSKHRLDAVCGPLTGGAFLAQTIAASLGVDFLFAERTVSDRGGLFPVDYRIAPALRQQLRSQRVALVDDAISVGSAVRSTYTDLRALGADPCVIGALLVIGPAAARFASEMGTPLERLADLPQSIWTPAECPMCAVGAPLNERPAG
jgi:orotate phosphoribosyltransferase